MLTYRNVELITVLASLTVNAMIPKGTRCVAYPADGTNFVTPASATVRGGYIVEYDVYPNDNGVGACDINKGGDFFGIVAIGASFGIGDVVYSAANGQITNSSAGGAVRVGTAREAVSTSTATQLVGINLSPAA